MRCTDDVSQNCTLETWMILLTNVTPISLSKKKSDFAIWKIIL